MKIQIINIYGTKSFNDNGNNVVSSKIGEPQSKDIVTSKFHESQSADFMTPKLSESQTMDSTAPKYEYQSMDFVTSKFHEIRPMDEFDINVVNLNSPRLWENWFDDFLSFYEQDLERLQVLFENSKNSTILIILPQNIQLKSLELKNHLDFMIAGLLKMVPKSISSENYKLFYENTVTDIGGIEYEASFNFIDAGNIVTKSRNDKITTIRVAKRFILTTLDVMTHKTNLLHFLREGKLMQSNDEVYPQWLIDYQTPADQELHDSIKEKEAAIEKLKEEIRIAEEKLKKNLEYKSILLYESDPLKSPVLNILEQMLDIDSLKIKNDKKEKFLIQYNDDLEFIGEVKGVPSNIRSEHIAQVELNYCKYSDNLHDEGADKELKALLIMNPFAAIPLNDREPVNEDQIKLAARNESLIIEAETLLHVYGRFTTGKLKSYNFKELLCKEKGLLTKTAADRYCVN